MKLKYYLRGAGFGIIFTTLVLMIGFSLHNTDEKIKNDVKSEPVMEAAEKSEDTVSEETASESQEKEIKPEEAAEPTEEVPMPTEAVSPENTEVEEYRPFYVEKGQSSNQVSINLAEQGFV
ncbi:MAG: hypothetical protein HUJ75_08795, partial [Parasporobacterium sp.]|nr:hypothetical protein [Parasporobacterium sp.]